MAIITGLQRNTKAYLMEFQGGNRLFEFRIPPQEITERINTNVQMTPTLAGGLGVGRVLGADHRVEVPNLVFDGVMESIRIGQTGRFRIVENIRRDYAAIDWDLEDLTAFVYAVSEKSLKVTFVYGSWSISPALLSSVEIKRELWLGYRCVRATVSLTLEKVRE